VSAALETVPADITTQAAVLPVAPAEEIVTSIKGFAADLTCRGYQFAIGGIYTHTGAVKACSAGFHAVSGYPLEVFTYYPPVGSRYAEVQQSGVMSRHGLDSKLASAKLSVTVELSLGDLVQRAVAWVIKYAKAEGGQHSTGDQSAASSTGDRSAASSTGDQSAASSTGYRSAASSTGDRSAASSTGYRSAASSTGYRSAASSTGDRSAASSTGYRSAAMSSGAGGCVQGAEGCALFLVYRDDDTGDILHAWAGIAGKSGIKPAVWYRLSNDGQPVEVVR